MYLLTILFIFLLYMDTIQIESISRTEQWYITMVRTDMTLHYGHSATIIWVYGYLMEKTHFFCHKIIRFDTCELFCEIS